MSRRVYLAAAFERQGELCGYRDDCRAAGLRVTSRWLDLAGEEALNPGAAAETCVIDLLAADTLVSFTDPVGVYPRGGRHVELGIALGITLVSAEPLTYFRHRYRLVVVGPIEHVFHAWPDVERFDTWPAALAALGTPRTTGAADAA
jgi:hypothetical protein